MAFDIDQITASAYPALVNAKRGRATNQWGDSSIFKALEKFGMVERKSLGPTIEVTIDYRRNPGAKFLQTDLEQLSLAKTEVLSAASYSPAQLSVPVSWSKMDEVKTPSENQKIAFSTQLMENGIESHDDLIEEALMAADTDGFIGLPGLLPDSGQGEVGGIDAAVETVWRHHADEYAADGSDLEAVLQEACTAAQKGSGSSMKIKLLVSGADPYNLYVGNLQVQKRFEGSATKGDLGFEALSYNGGLWVFGQYGDDHIYGLNKSFRVIFSKQYFRDKSKTQESDDAEGFSFKIYSAGQTVVDAKSRLFVVDQAD